VGGGRCPVAPVALYGLVLDLFIFLSLTTIYNKINYQIAHSYILESNKIDL